MDDERSRRKIGAAVVAHTVAFLVLSLGFACGVAILLRKVFHKSLDDPVAASWTVGAFVIGMLVSGDLILPWLFKILPASLVKSVRKSKRRRK